MKHATTYAFAVVALSLTLATQPARADMEVLESTAPNIETGAMLRDDVRLKLPKDTVVRVLVFSANGNSTKTLKGPYEGTVANYRQRRSWREWFARPAKDRDPAMAAQRRLQKQ